MHSTLTRSLALPALPAVGALLAKKATAAYALFNAAHAYGIPKYDHSSHYCNSSYYILILALSTQSFQKRRTLRLINPL